MSENIVIRITGDSGDGIQLIGEQLTLTAATSGKEVRTLPDFPAEIRAPAGTLAGVSGFQLAMADNVIFTAGETLDVLVAMNPAALKHSLAYLKHGGLLLLNEDGFTEKDWKKAGLTPDYLQTQASHYQLISIPLVSQTQKAAESAEVTHAQAKKAKNFYVLGVVLWLFDLPTAPSNLFIQNKFKAQAQVMKANQACLKAGYDYAETLELSRQAFECAEVKRAPGAYRQVNGIEAISLALATIALKTKRQMLVAGYPITPASGILQACAQLEEYGINLFQAEDEIAAIGACLGASFGGQLALTASSGPGMDLKTEALGLAVVSELPLVVLDVQRGGVSTGLPTKTGQSDLNLALYGRHGEAPMPVIAARSPSDCFQTIIEAFCIATRHMTPVIVLLDAYLANAAEPWKIPSPEDITAPVIEQNRFPEPFKRDALGARSWNVPGEKGFIYQLGGLEKQGDSGQVSYDADNHEKMVKLRGEKIATIASTYPPLQLEGRDEAKILLISWGSTYGSMKEAISACDAQNLPVAHLHLRHLNPLPKDLGALLNRYELVLVAELNTGQLCQQLRAKYLVDAKAITQCNGQPFSKTRLIQAILEEARHVIL